MDVFQNTLLGPVSISSNFDNKNIDAGEMHFNWLCLKGTYLLQFCWQFKSSVVVMIAQTGALG